MNNVIIGNFRALHHESHGGTKGTLRKRLFITYWVKDFFGQSKACILIMRRCFMQVVILNELSLNKGKLTRKLFLAHQSAKKCWSPFTQLSTGYTCRSLNFSRLLRVFSTPSVSILLKVTKLGVACKATIQ